MQKEIQLTDKTLLVVSVPKDSFGHWINPVFNENFYYHTPQLEGMSDIDIHTITLPQGDWKLLGIYPELTEEQASKFMPKIFPTLEDTLYYSYTPKTAFDTFKTALESFQSIMERENITGYDKYAILIKSK